MVCLTKSLGRRLAVTLAAVALAGGLLAACGSSEKSAGSEGKGLIRAVGAENEYANVIAQIGAPYVRVTSILDNPNTDPHTFESSPAIAAQVSRAQLVVQNGLGYDDFMSKLESAAPDASRRVIVVAHLLGLPADTPNPHLWYDPTTMAAVAKAVAADLSAMAPAHASYFAERAKVFDASLEPWLEAVASFKTRYGGTPVAVTEPVADYLLEAMGADILTPFRFQAAIMNGTDPSPQDVALEKTLLSERRVKVFCYNQQVVDPLTQSLEADALAHHVPVVGVYETMPTPGYDYQSWMLAEVHALTLAVSRGVSTEKL